MRCVEDGPAELKVTPAMESAGDTVLKVGKDPEELRVGNGEGSKHREVTLDGTVNLFGKPVNRDETGGWRACAFIFGNEVAERVASYGVVVNLITYLTGVLHQSTPTAISNVNNWSGTVFLTPILGAFVADALLGRYWTITVFSVFYVAGSVMLTVAASVPSLRPPACVAPPNCIEASPRQLRFFYVALYVLSLGTGGMKPCVVTLGADQFDEEDPKEDVKKKSFFTWWYMAVGIGVVFSTTILVYIEDDVGWGWGFGIPAVLLVVSLIVFFVGTPYYRHKPPTGSPLTQFARVIVASLRNWKLRNIDLLYESPERKSSDPGRRQMLHSENFRFLDRAAAIDGTVQPGRASPWKLCTVTEVEECKLFVGMFPIWATNLMFQIVLSQATTFFTKQGASMDTRLGSFKIPPASFQFFSAISIVTAVPLYDRVLVPVTRRFTGNPRGITLLTRMGIGIFLIFVSMIVAALVEGKRHKAAEDHGLLDHPFKTIPISIFWLLPQYVIGGVADAFCIVAQMEFFYDQAPDHMKSVGSAAYLSILGVGSYLSTALLKTTNKYTGRGGRQPWILNNNLNRSKVQSYYWLIATLTGLDFLLFLFVAHRYEYKKVESSVVKDEDKDTAVQAVELKPILP